MRKSRTSNNETPWLALYVRRAVNESFDNYQQFYFRKIVGVGRDEIGKHKFMHTPIEDERYTRLITLLPSQQPEPISCVLQAIAIDDPPHIPPPGKIRPTAMDKSKANITNRIKL